MSLIHTLFRALAVVVATNLPNQLHQLLHVVRSYGTRRMATSVTSNISASRAASAACMRGIALALLRHLAHKGGCSRAKHSASPKLPAEQPLGSGSLLSVGLPV